MKQLLTFLALSVSFLGISQEIITEEIAMVNGEIQIPGALTYPQTQEKIPLVIFVHGSGNVDRNGNQAPLIMANYIKLLADSLNAHQMAFYRYDKRSAIKENIPKMTDIRFKDLASDVKKVIAHFKDDERFSGIYPIGHSQGSLVAMLASDASVNGFISLAGAGTPIGQTIVAQIKKQNEDLAKAAEAHLEELMETDTIITVNPFLKQLFAPQNQKFIKSWMVYNPKEEIVKLQVPVLIINGESDFQVPTTDAENLKNAEPDAKLLLVPNMNHVLKTVANTTENKASYYDPDFPLSSVLVRAIVEFIKNNG